jgi:hypothetical protein
MTTGTMLSSFISILSLLFYSHLTLTTNRNYSPSLSLNPLSTVTSPLLPKVFIIGLPRTYTTSIANYIHNSDFTVFAGPSFTLNYKHLASLYPSAKFILTLRQNETIWLHDLKLHVKTKQSEENWPFPFGDYDPELEDEVYLDAYQNHTDSVREFFDLPSYEDRLLELVVNEEEKEDGNWRQLGKFLGLGDGVMERLHSQDVHSGEEEMFQERQEGRISRSVDKMKKGVKRKLVKVLRGLGWLTAIGL